MATFIAETTARAADARSAGVPRRLGFTLVETVPEMVWVLSPAAAPPGRPPTPG